MPDSEGDGAIGEIVDRHYTVDGCVHTLGNCRQRVAASHGIARFDWDDAKTNGPRRGWIGHRGWGRHRESRNGIQDGSQGLLGVGDASAHNQPSGEDRADQRHDAQNEAGGQPATKQRYSSPTTAVSWGGDFTREPGV